jgi:hypothetical protein
VAFFAGTLSYVPCSHYCDQGLLLMCPLLVLILCSCCGCCARENEGGGEGCGACCYEGSLCSECFASAGLACWAFCGRCACGVRWRDRCCECCASRAEPRRRRREQNAIGFMGNSRTERRARAAANNGGEEEEDDWQTPGWYAPPPQTQNHLYINGHDLYIYAHVFCLSLPELRADFTETGQAQQRQPGSRESGS